jgi:photosystem II stability/assembly factor-like uncharacterized protein
MITTADGGATWTKELANLEGKDISCATTSDCVVVGAFRQIFVTADGGSTWRAQAPAGTADRFLGIYCATATHCIAIGSRQTTATDNRTIDVGLIITTVDGGNHWHEQLLGGPALLAIHCSTAMNCVTVGRSGAILTTMDGGDTWSQQMAGVGLHLHGVQCAGQADHCLVVGEDGAILLSTSTFTPVYRQQLSMVLLESQAPHCCGE